MGSREDRLASGRRGLGSRVLAAAWLETSERRCGQRKGRVARRMLGWRVGRGGREGLMSAFLFKQTETASCTRLPARRGRSGRGTGPAPRAPAYVLPASAGPSWAGAGTEGRAHPGLRGRAGAGGMGGSGAAGGTALQRAQATAGLGKRRGSTGGSRRLRSRPGRCPSSASSGLQRWGELWQDAVIVILEILFLFKGLFADGNQHFSTSGLVFSKCVKASPDPMSF